MNNLIIPALILLPILFWFHLILGKIEKEEAVQNCEYSGREFWAKVWEYKFKVLDFKK